MVRFYKLLSLCTAIRTNNPSIVPELQLTLLHTKQGHRINPNSINPTIPRLKCIDRTEESAARTNDKDEGCVRREIIKSWKKRNDARDGRGGIITSPHNKRNRKRKSNQRRNKRNVDYVNSNDLVTQLLIFIPTPNRSNHRFIPTQNRCHDLLYETPNHLS
jgi:hypothetical protein